MDTGNVLEFDVTNNLITFSHHNGEHFFSCTTNCDIGINEWSAFLSHVEADDICEIDLFRATMIISMADNYITFASSIVKPKFESRYTIPSNLCATAFRCLTVYLRKKQRRSDKAKRVSKANIVTPELNIKDDSQ